MERIHLIGIGGSGLSAIARLLAEQGVSVSGSDRAESPFTSELRAMGIPVFIGHAAENISGATLVVRSSAIPEDNPEVMAAKQAGIPVLKRAEFLEKWLKPYQVIAVAGTHGKTTTTAMIAWMLSSLAQNPSYIIGGVARDLHANAHAGKGSLFVIEADEYDRMFLGLHPHIAVITYLEHDHPDCFPTMAEYTRAFQDFIQQIQPDGALLLNGDHPLTRELGRSAPKGVRVLTYGEGEENTYFLKHPTVNSRGGFSADIWKQMPDGENRRMLHLDLQVPGKHNLLNALAALAVADQLELMPGPAAEALHLFHGTGRRFEVRGEANGVVLIDDYAHHPTEIRTTLAAARARYPERRIWAVWQPHTYSRTQTLMKEFCQAFDDADAVLVLEIYAAREKNPGFSAREVVQRMKHPEAVFQPTLEAARNYLLDRVQPGDVVLVLSAGDADALTAELLDVLSQGRKG
ncbi:MULTISPECIES: UDP-N-acetylmuramate--L-alanine ligase [Anaerolinea]|uniref:UDP-N-acetylmuramate--L-alanine ligase n=1 Tax=Anaerolinea TaxID=233189 RepID=UPI0026060E39|nr:UDP-N-acetylmuramate--L-alanine ligase [Anaerolinea thermophila]